MTIRAILQDGRIQPLDPLPSQWTNGKELIVEEPVEAPTEAELRKWQEELEEGINRIPQEDHDAFLKALAEVERESKESMKREWGLK